MKSAIAKLGRYRGYFFLGFPAILVIGSMAFLVEEAVFLSAQEKDVGVWLFTSVLPYALGNTLALIVYVVLGTLVVGVFQAFVMVFTDLPGKKLWNILFILPLSFPIYVMAFVYVGLFEFKGFVSLRGVMGAAFVFILCLSPYVYLLAKGALQNIGVGLARSGKVLGYSPLAIFFKGIIPCSRPCLLAAAVLVALEVLADFGAVTVFNYDTLTTAIYSAWSSLFSLSLASRLALVLTLVALVVLRLEGSVGGRGRYISTCQPREDTTLFRCSLGGKILLSMGCGIWVFLSLLLPLGQLLVWGWDYSWDNGEGVLLLNTIGLALTGAGLISLWSLGMVVFSREVVGSLASGIRHTALMGYALPGTLIGVAFFAFFSRTLFLTPGQGGWALLLCGYGVRFLNVAFRPLSVAMESIPHCREWAARTLGVKEGKVWRSVYFPHLKGAALTSFLLAFVEISKEMPMTLLLRSTEQRTLAVKIYELTSEGEWERAAPLGIVLVLLGMVSLVVLNRFEQEMTRG